MIKETRIKITGKGGQGVKFLTNVLGKLFKNKNFKVSYFFLYDAAMRGGNIESELVFSNNFNQSPMGENFDLLVMLSPAQASYKKKSKKIIKASNNMIALGMILKNLGFDLEKPALLKVLPERNKDINLKAIEDSFHRES